MQQRIIEVRCINGIYKNLEQRFIHTNLGAKNDKHLSIGGTEGYLYCKLVQESRYIQIYCTEIGREDIKNAKYLGVMYDVAFYEKNDYFITGRAFVLEEALSSIEDWLNGMMKDDLYLKHNFIDKKKKSLTKILNKINSYIPELKENTDINAVAKVSITDKISIESNERGCEGYFWGYEDNPRFIFKWQSTKIFEYSSNNQEMIANLINDWVVNLSMPSMLAMKYQDVDFGKLGIYYELGKGVEGEFILSWDSIERFYKEWCSFKDDAIKLIHEMREIGLDRKLRAGQSLFFFILSRARRHGLNNDHKYIQITFLGKCQMNITTNIEEVDENIEYEVRYGGYLKELVEKLLNEDIN